jgi:hypothetical protein
MRLYLSRKECGYSGFQRRADVETGSKTWDGKNYDDRAQKYSAPLWWWKREMVVGRWISGSGLEVGHSVNGRETSSSSNFFSTVNYFELHHRDKHHFF